MKKIILFFFLIFPVYVYSETCPGYPINIGFVSFSGQGDPCLGDYTYWADFNWDGGTVGTVGFGGYGDYHIIRDSDQTFMYSIYNAGFKTCQTFSCEAGESYTFQLYCPGTSNLIDSYQFSPGGIPDPDPCPNEYVTITIPYSGSTSSVSMTVEVEIAQYTEGFGLIREFVYTFNPPADDQFPNGTHVVNFPKWWHFAQFPGEVPCRENTYVIRGWRVWVDGVPRDLDDFTPIGVDPDSTDPTPPTDPDGLDDSTDSDYESPSGDPTNLDPSVDDAFENAGSTTSGETTLDQNGNILWINMEGLATVTGQQLIAEEVAKLGGILGGGSDGDGGLQKGLDILWQGDGNLDGEPDGIGSGLGDGDLGSETLPGAYNLGTGSGELDYSGSVGGILTDVQSYMPVAPEIPEVSGKTWVYQMNLGTLFDIPLAFEIDLHDYETQINLMRDLMKWVISILYFFAITKKIKEAFA